MTPFQWLSLGVLGLLWLREVVRLRQGRGARAVGLLRAFVWAGAAVAIALPDLTNRVALAVGIGRGADVVLYVFVLVFLGAAFFLYARLAQVQQQLTLLVRHLALRDPQPPGDPQLPSFSSAEPPS
jgi:hypothetical protein